MSLFEGEKHAWRFAGREKGGDEDNGSKAGSRQGAGRLTPAVAGSDGCILILLGDESIIKISSSSLLQSLFE
jgi:hypothetical protein